MYSVWEVMGKPALKHLGVQPEHMQTSWFCKNWLPYEILLTFSLLALFRNSDRTAPLTETSGYNSVLKSTDRGLNPLLHRVSIGFSRNRGATKELVVAHQFWQHSLEQPQSCCTLCLGCNAPWDCTLILTPSSASSIPCMLEFADVAQGQVCATWHWGVSPSAYFSQMSLGHTKGHKEQGSGLSP